MRMKSNRFAVATGFSMVGMLLTLHPVHAEEGMWRLDQIPSLTPGLEKSGLRVDAAQLASLTTGPAAAVVNMSGGTASFVSEDGLLLTNHHVAYDAIQMNSDAEHDYLKHGFLAPSRERELPAPGYQAVLMTDMRDVTADMRAAAPERLEPRARFKAIERRQKELVARCEAEGAPSKKSPPQTGVRCSVVSFDHGLQYFLISSLELRDIRLVYAPPESIGDFGGEVDNFMWPRHSGDFSFMRAYVGKDGKPADYSPHNVPYHPKRVLKLAPKPIQPGEGLMIFGNPYITARKLTAASMRFEEEMKLPEVEATYSQRMALLMSAAESNRERAIRLSAEIATLSNTLKLTRGKRAALAKTRVVARRAADEARLLDWIAADEARTQRFGNVIPRLNQLTQESMAHFPTRTRLHRLYSASSLLNVADTLIDASVERKKPDIDRQSGYQERNLAQHRQWLEQMQRDLDLEVQKKALEQALISALKLPDAQRIKGLDALFPGATPEARISRVVPTLNAWFEATQLDEQAVRLALWDKAGEGGEAALKKLQDPLLDLALALRPENLESRARAEAHAGEWERLFPQYLEAWKAFDPRPQYPDANGTLRFTYGVVAGYSPADSVHYAPFTTMAGLLDKNTGTFPFDAPERVLTQAATVPNLPVNFLATVDTTGGNSGSPVLNGQGELVGLLFDGNFESTGDEFVFWEEKQRSICVDMRYIRFMIELVDQATLLREELGWPAFSRAEATSGP